MYNTQSIVIKQPILEVLSNDYINIYTIGCVLLNTSMTCHITGSDVTSVAIVMLLSDPSPLENEIVSTTFAHASHASRVRTTLYEVPDGIYVRKIML